MRKLLIGLGLVSYVTSTSVPAGIVLSGTQNTAAGTSAVVVSGHNNDASAFRSSVLGGLSNEASASFTAIVGGNSNSIAGTNSSILGGLLNAIGATSTRSGIGSGRANQITTGKDAFIGAGWANLVESVEGAVVGGQQNVVSGDSSLVGAGQNNTVSGLSSAIVAGYDNSVSEGASFIGAGYENEIVGTGTNHANAIVGGRGNYVNGTRCNVAGGFNNDISLTTAESSFSAISGGRDNVIDASSNSTVLGGGGNRIGDGVNNAVDAIAGGSFTRTYAPKSVVLGTQAQLDASATGSFYFADSSNTGTAKSAADTFHARFAGGYEFYTNSGASVGVSLSPGATAWNALSDRGSKENFAQVDSREVLEKVAAMPMSTWNYKHDGETRYMGVMAQDLHEAFGLGQNETTINTLVADGVALAAIQGVNEKLEDEVNTLRAENADLKARLDRIEAMLAGDQKAK